MPEFVPGVELARAYYDDVVRPLLTMPHSVGLFGRGSEVLGFDTERSTDHGWGPRLLLFVEDAADIPDLQARLDAEIGDDYRGYATRFAPSDFEPAVLRVDVWTANAWFVSRIGFDPAGGVATADWLATPTQVLRSAISGAVFHDGLDELNARRTALTWYPDDVWRYIIGCQWERISQEEPFVGRTGEVGDDLGSRILAARLARDLMRLCFLLEREYPPYSKWLGHAFGRLRCASTVGPHLARSLAASSWQRREAEFGAAAELVGQLHNELDITAPVDATLRQFHGRPFLVLDSHRFAAAAYAAITDPEITALPRNVGAIDQWVDGAAQLLDNPVLARRAAKWVGGSAG